MRLPGSQAIKVKKETPEGGGTDLKGWGGEERRESDGIHME